MKIDFSHIGEALTVGVKVVEEVIAIEAQLQKVGDTSDLPPVTAHVAGRHIRFTTKAEVIP